MTISLSTLRLDDFQKVPGYLVSSDPYWFKEKDRFDEIESRTFEKIGRAIPRQFLDPEQGRKLVSINPGTNRVFREISISNGLKKKELILLILLSWEFEEVLGWSVRNKIYDKAMKFDEIAQAEVLFALSNKHNSFLVYSWSFRSVQSLFGHINQNGKKVIHSVRLRAPKEQKVQKPQRARGYRDKGSLPASDRWIEKNFASPTHRRIEDIDSQIRLLLRISSERGYFVPQALLEDLLDERRSLISQIVPLDDYTFSLSESV